ncbi:hypothetical protein J9332_41400, partial [Aquimarina celericrescens]|nr:hypothetical protein [Aquimarina celericrescens]
TELKNKKMNSYLLEVELERKNIQIVTTTDDFKFDNKITYFDVSSRTYTKKGTIDEVKFMKYLLPEKGKFTPFNS